MNGIPESQMSEFAPAAIAPIGIKKRCLQCKESKDESEFYRDKNRSDGRYPYCITCQKIRKKQYYAENRKSCIEKTRKWSLDNPSKRCEQSKKWRIANRVKANYSVKAWRLRNKERKATSNREWAKNNRDRINERGKRYDAKRRESAFYRISQNISSSMCAALKGNKKNLHLDQLKTHLQKRFTPEMTWDNYGSYWHVDHKIPKSAFNFLSPIDIDFKKCWSLKNLQPLEAKENISKHNKLLKPFQPSLTIGV
jgi:hypothetical protein